ncbi:hypothetical protein ABTH86_18785, partial [Acinetobacter baumannii]
PQRALPQLIGICRADGDPKRARVAARLCPLAAAAFLKILSGYGVLAGDPLVGGGGVLVAPLF